MGYKITGFKSETARIITLNESDWSIESNTVVSGSGNYEILDLTEGNKSIIGRATNGLVKSYSSVSPEYYTTIPEIPWTETFSELDTTLWTTAITGAETGTVTISNDKLRILASGSTSVKVELNYKLSGDFDIQVDYDVVNGPDVLGWYFSLSLVYDSGKWAQIARSKNPYGNVMYHDRGNPWAGGNTAGAINTGKLRVTRVGSLNTWLYWNGSSWSTLASASGWDSGPCIVQLYNSYYDVTSPERTVDYDNFKINSGVLTEV